MNSFQRISAAQAQQLMREGATVADIRDETSFHNGHIKGARHLVNENLQSFIETEDPDRPLIVCCYHGHSSQMAAQFLIERGFEEVYSLDGGFEFWLQQFPDACEQGGD